MYLKNLAMQDWTDITDVMYQVLSLENTTWGPDVLKHQGHLPGPSDANANISQEKKKVVISFCMRASGTTPSLWASRLLSRLLLSAEHGSVAMLSSAVKPPREMSPCNHFCSHPAALFSDFLTTLWVCAGNWVTGKIQCKAEKWQKITYFGHFY